MFRFDLILHPSLQILNRLLIEFLKRCRHYSVPLSPTYPGLEKFTGRVSHSHVYRHAERFSGKTVAVVGGGASGQDIMLDVAAQAERVSKYYSVTVDCLRSCNNEIINNPGCRLRFHYTTSFLLILRCIFVIGSRDFQHRSQIT